MAIYLTGDTHRKFDRIFQFCDDYGTTEDDVLVILGDAGINYYCDLHDRELKSELSLLPITFKEIKQYIARNVKLSIRFEDGYYNNYLMISDVPESKYDEFYVYGIGMVDVEFSRDVYLKSDDPDGVCFTSKNMTMEAALEIALCKKPRQVERKINKGLAFQDLKSYLQVFGTLAIVCEEDYKEDLYEFRADIPNKYDDLYLYGIGLENNYDVDESARGRRYDTWCNKKLVIVLSKQPRQDVVKNTESATYGKGPFFF